MLTRNFYSCMFVQLTGADFRKGVDCTGAGDAYLFSPGNISASMKKAHTNAMGNSPSYNGVIFGSGTTPATPSDYMLEAQITNGISVTNPTTAVANLTDEYLEYTATYGIYASLDTTISEIGLFNQVNGRNVMYDRTVLETPIVIPAGQSKQVTYTIRINYPTT